MDKNPLLRLTFAFSLLIIEYCELLEEKRKYVLSKQLLKSGTSIGANSIEAQNPESKADFIHKMKVAAKEGEETERWLLLCKHSPSYPDIDNLLNTLTTILKLLNKIVGTSKRN